MIGPKFYAWDKDGNPLAFGKLYTYKARTNVPKDTYQSEDQVVKNTNPVILNGEGYANVYLDGSYKMVLKDADENEIWSADPVTAQSGEEWVHCHSATYLSSTSFKIAGNVTDRYVLNRRVRIDNNTTSYSFSSITASVFAGGETTITIQDPVVAVGIIGVCASIITDESTDLVGIQERSIETLKRNRYTTNFSTLALAVASADTLRQFSDGTEEGSSVVLIKDRANTFFDNVPEGTVVANSHSIIDCVGIPSLSLVARIGAFCSIAALGSVGDGVANETALFAVADTYTSTTFDLLGLIYVVDTLPSGDYTNGQFIVGNNWYQKPSNDSHEYAKAQFNLKRDYSDSRYTSEMVPALENGTVILGDSISHGAYQGALYDNGWVNLFKRMVNAENGHSVDGSYGLIPLLSWNQPENNNTVDLASIAFTNNPTSVTSIEGETLLNSLAFEVTTTATVKSTLPTFQATVRVWYVQHTGGGTLEVFVNGVSVTTQDTAGSLNLAANITVPMTDNGLGLHVIEVKASVGTVTFSGFGYENAVNAVNNFSQSGRKLLDATELGLKQLCTTGNLVVALGHNDVGVVDGNPTNEALFTANINHIINYCLRYNTNVVVPDFCWFTPVSSYVRQELKRLALATSGVYVDFPSLLTRDYRNKSEFSASFLLVDTMHYWQDGSHPNELGGQFIAETIAKAVGLGCTTKNEALLFHDFPMPLRLEGTSLKNRFTASPNLTTFRRNGNVYTYNIRTTKVVAGGGVPIGVYPINVTGLLPIAETSNGNMHAVGDLKLADGSNISNFSVDQQGLITIYVNQVFLGNQEFTFTRMWK